MILKKENRWPLALMIIGILALIGFLFAAVFPSASSDFNQWLGGPPVIRDTTYYVGYLIVAIVGLVFTVGGSKLYKMT